MESNIMPAIFISALIIVLKRTVLLLSRCRFAAVVQHRLKFIPAAIITLNLLGKLALTPPGVNISLLALEFEPSQTQLPSAFSQQ